MHRARITEHPLTQLDAKFWYTLDAGEGAPYPGYLLRHTWARRVPGRWLAESEADPAERRRAIERLVAWVRKNG
jgi:hypothetical protein